MAHQPADLSRLDPRTRLVAATRKYSEHGMVNPAVYHASTVLFDDMAAFADKTQPYVYGRRGTPTTRALEEAIAMVEGGGLCRLAPSGLAAISTALLCFLKAGDHLLMADAVYRPARTFADNVLARFGVETTYYDPLLGAGVADLMRPQTRIVYTESPGSQTMQVQDIPAIAAAAHDAGALVAIDNTWAAGYYFDAFAHGCDISIQAATKYIVGHSDVMLGSITVTDDLAEPFRVAYEDIGVCAGPDDIYLALRGLRTLDVRLERHMNNALEVARWLEQRAEVERVLYPALESDPGHALWKRDFTGASGLFSVLLKPAPREAVAAFIDGLELFGIGASWGGYESLILPFNPSDYRTATTWDHDGPAVRMHIGLEAPSDLIADLAAGFERFNQAAG